MILVGFIGALGVTPSFAAAPQLVAPADAGRALAVLALRQNLGMAVGPHIFGKIAGRSWSWTGYLCCPILLLAVFFGQLD
jgi:MFS family permease